MADVYKVHDQLRNAELALKVLKPDLAQDSVFVRHFREEAEALMELDHPNIVRFYSFERDDEYFFIVMDYVEGVTLREEMQAQNSRLGNKRIATVMRGVCAALEYAHKNGYIHRDIKPTNILVGNDQVFLTDFGIARLTGSASSTLGKVGTPGYMSPEQIRGDTTSPASDIYSLGALLYEMTTGARPFTGKSQQTTGSTSERVRWEHLHLSPPAPRVLNPSISPHLERIILRCLEKEPSRRFSTVQNLLSTLEQSLLRDASSARAEYIPGPAQTMEPIKHVDTLPASNRKAKKAWVWLLVVIPIIILLVLKAGGGGGSPVVPLIQSTAARDREPTLMNFQAPTASTPSPSFSIRAYDPSTDQNADCIKCQFADWEEPKAPGSYYWNVSYPLNMPVRLLLGWCAVDEQTLDANWSAISFELIVDGIYVDLSKLNLETFITPKKNPCYGYSGVLTDWPSGRHEYTQILHFYRTLNDGWNTYEAGEYIENFIVTVK